MSIYRHIYETHFGSIPKELDGRSYEIHHIDGNHENNSIDNLKCITICEHYNIHYIQEDWAACSMIIRRMGLTPEEISRQCSIFAKKRVANGTHNLLDKDAARERNLKRVEAGTHHLLGPEINRKRIDTGTHNFLGPENNRKRVEVGTHNFLNHPTYTCPHCGKIGKGTANMFRWHFDKCKSA